MFAPSQPPEFYQGMFDQTPMENKHNMLHPLNVEQTMLVAPHELVSPASTMSGYSSPTSPHSGPFTPVQPMHRQYSLGNEHGVSCESQLYGSPDLALDYGQWGDGSNGMWENGQEMLFNGDFDLNSIPPIELGNAKFQDELNHQFDSSMSLPEYHDAYGMEQYQREPHTYGSYEAMQFPSDMMSGHGY